MFAYVTVHGKIVVYVSTLRQAITLNVLRDFNMR